MCESQKTTFTRQFFPPTVGSRAQTRVIGLVRKVILPTESSCWPKITNFQDFLKNTLDTCDLVTFPDLPLHWQIPSTKQMLSLSFFSCCSIKYPTILWFSAHSTVSASQCSECITVHRTPQSGLQSLSSCSQASSQK